jgi:hypothetical protein
MVFSARRPQSGGAFDREFTQTRALKRLPFVLLILPKSLLCLETGQVHNSELRSPIAKAYRPETFCEWGVSGWSPPKTNPPVRALPCAVSDLRIMTYAML